MGHSRPGNPVSKLAKDLEAGTDRGAKVGGSGRKIHLHEVIWPHADREKLLEEFAKDGFGVVYAVQEDGLASQGYACVGEDRSMPARTGP